MKTIKDFEDGKVSCIFTVDIFNEGVNFPDVECLLFLRITRSNLSVCSISVLPVLKSTLQDITPFCSLQTSSISTLHELQCVPFM